MIVLLMCKITLRHITRASWPALHWYHQIHVRRTEIPQKTNRNIGEIHYHRENKTNGGKQIEFSAESNHFEKKSKVGINEMYSNC